MSGSESIIIFSKGDAFNLLDGSAHGTRLPVEDLRRNLDEFISSLRSLLPTVADAGTGFALRSVDVAVGIDGKGHVGFLGTGVEVGAQATITLTFAR